MVSSYLDIDTYSQSGLHQILVLTSITLVPSDRVQHLECTCYLVVDNGFAGRAP